MRKIDINTWKRRETYNNFINYTNPVFAVGTRLDVTELISYCKREEKGFFVTFLYFVSECLNHIEEFCTRIIDEDVVIFERIRPSFIVMLEDEKLVTCIADANEDFEEFYKRVKGDIEEIREKKEVSFNKEKHLDCVFISTLPWTDFTAVINPYNFDDKSGTSIPRITWGKYVENTKGRMEMAIDVAAHHALIDGKQVSRFYENIQQAINNPEKFIGGKRG